MKSYQIREKFLLFFKENGHKVYEGAPIVPNDPTLLFTVAGMVQFKQFFLGIKSPPNPNVTSIQKCIRTNDIDFVGVTPRHLTSFEMLGTFSFGGYFKKRAIEMAWSFLIDQLKLNKDRLVVSVYEEDEESYKIWSQELGLDRSRIYKLGKDSNFWSAGPTGPCGPSTEIYYCIGDPKHFDHEGDQYLEIWNLVFTQFNRLENGSLEELPNKNIDTGMGLERIAMILQGKESCYDIDLFEPILDKLTKISGKRYENSELNIKKSFRIVADHLRSSILLIGEGVKPSNERQGYILRRLIRRGVRYGALLGIKGTFLHSLVDCVVDAMTDITRAMKDNIKSEIREEEDRFVTTLEKGLKLAADALKEAANSSGIIAPQVAFKLYDTYGFPFEMTQELCVESGVSIDEDAFKDLMEKHRDISRGSQSSTLKAEDDSYYSILHERIGPTIFYEHEYSCEAKVLDVQTKGEYINVALDKTIFYAESGGQIADKGTILGDSFKGDVVDVQKIDEIFVHILSPKMGKVIVGDVVKLTINDEEREDIRRHHTSVHLLHSALKEVLGDDISQAGSIVTPEKARLDFSYNRPLGNDEIRKIENIINDQVLKNIKLNVLIKDKKSALEMGAIALFGDKYGEKVRVVEIPNFSIELCGGTHVKSTGDIGLIKIVDERGIASGIRRIEIVAGRKFLSQAIWLDNSISSIAKLLKVSKGEVEKKVRNLQEENIHLKKMQEGSSAEIIAYKILESMDKIAIKDETLNLFILPLDSTSMGFNSKIIHKLVSRKVSNFIGLAIGDKFSSVLVSNALSSKYSAKEIFKKLSSIFDGRGGGNNTVAQGALAGKINEISYEFRRIVEENLS